MRHQPAPFQLSQIPTPSLPKNLQPATIKATHNLRMNQHHKPPRGEPGVRIPMSPT